VVTVFGTRPQFIKLSGLWQLFEERFRSILVDSGQHYDYELAGSFHDVTGLRTPDYHLGIGSCAPAAQIGRIADRLDTLLGRLRPDAVVVFGDTSTTAGGAVAAAFRNIPLAHVEAGLRSYDPRAAEEKNRVIADHLARWLFVPTESAAANLRREGITRGIVGVGDVLHENWRRWRREISVDAMAARYNLAPGNYYFVTCHRAETVDDPNRLRQVARILRALDRPTVFAAHPRARKSLSALGLWGRLKQSRHLRLTPPLPYPESLALTSGAHTVLTDSGGVQREAAWFGTPCLVLRDRTEWTELVACGAIRVTDLDAAVIERNLRRRRFRMRPVADRFHNSRYPSRRIVNRLARDLVTG